VETCEYSQGGWFLGALFTIGTSAAAAGIYE